MPESGDPKQKAKLGAAVAIFALAGIIIAWQVASGGPSEPMDFFYDQSEGELFLAPRDAIPPIKGINDDEADAVRAVVIALDGDPGTTSARKVAYLESNSPQLKDILTQRRDALARGEQPMALDRQFARAHTLVRSVQDDEWVSIMSDEGGQIVSIIGTPDADGKPPVLCIP